MIPTEDLILTPPLWGLGKTPRVIAYGPFMVEQNKNRLVGMYLMQEDDETISFWDGSRERYFKENDITLRGLQVKDAELVQLDSDRAGLSKEDVISKALLMFQPPVL